MLNRQTLIVHIGLDLSLNRLDNNLIDNRPFMVLFIIKHYIDC